MSAKSWLALALLAAGCGSSSVSRPDPPPTAATLPPGPAVAVITASGLEPQVIHIYDGSRRVFIENRDTRSHSLYSDQHPTHGECAGKVNVGDIQPGERREVSDLPFDACYFHDDSLPGNRSFTGVLVVH